jgi:formylglycine-generating enzyme required for sulfatase activity
MTTHTLGLVTVAALLITASLARAADTTSAPAGQPALARSGMTADEAAACQKAWAAHLGVPVEKTLDLGGGATLVLVLIPPGEFLMGAPDSEVHRKTDEGPQHPVRISHPFYLGKYEVTQGQFQAVTGVNRSRYTGDPNLPVERVAWDDCTLFCQKVSQKLAGGSAGLVSVRLPTEAQWEYACRAGTTTMHSCPPEAGVENFAWIGGNGEAKTHPVGQKRPNPWGLYDMHGNVWEWCADWYGPDYYAKSAASATLAEGRAAGAVTDPTGPATGTTRIARGGSWDTYPANSKSAVRSSVAPDYADADRGFRVVAEIK